MIGRLQSAQMEPILKEVERALEARLWYAAVALALTLPDICASMEAKPDARKDGQKARYIRWCKQHLPDNLASDGALFWALRSGVVHEGRYKSNGIDRIVFTTPEGGGLHALTWQVGNQRFGCFDVGVFCGDVIASVRRWYEHKKDDPVVSVNAERLVRLRPSGFLPNIKGLVVIA